MPAELVFEFDVYHPQGAEEDYQRAWARLHEVGAPDILWTPLNGGHWLPIRGDDIQHFFRDWDHLSTAQYIVPRQSSPFRVLPINVDPPEHAPYRALFQEPLAPKEVDRLEGFMRHVVQERIDRVYGNGRCEFITQFANHVPVSVFLQMTGLPPEDGEMILGWAEEQIYSLDEQERAASMLKISEYMAAMVKQRRLRPPGEDRLSRLVHARINGRLLNEDELKGICSLLLIGGLDTVASMIGFVMHFLARSPSHRLQLTESPALIPRAIDEFLRRFGLTIPGRIVRKDFTHQGVQFKEGDMMVLPTMMHGLDERKFANPLEVDFHRAEKPIYSTFGSGVHRCPGSYLARTELRLILQEWLQRIPDFSMSPGERVRIRTGIHGSITYLPLAWSA